MPSYNVIFASLACSLAVVALGLVSAWAQRNPTSQKNWGAYGYLGVPIWRNKTNIMAWHPILMVAGFFLSQVFSLSAIAFLGNKTGAFLTHFFWQLASICTLIAGLRAMVDYKIENKISSLISLHSWVGVLAVVFFAFNVLTSNIIGFGGLLGKKFQPTATFTHMVFALSTLVLSFLAIVSGVQLEQNTTGGGCAFLKANPDHTALNSAFYYKRLPWACKLSNGVGVSVLFATVFTVLALVASRSVALFEDEAEEDVVEGAKDEADAVEMVEA